VQGMDEVLEQHASRMDIVRLHQRTEVAGQILETKSCLLCCCQSENNAAANESERRSSPFDRTAPHSLHFC